MFKEEYKKAFDEIRADDGSIHRILECASGKSKNEKKAKVWKPAIVMMFLALGLITSVSIPTFAKEMERMTNVLETGAIDYTSYKSLQRNNPEWTKNSFIPEYATVRKDGVIMKVELATFCEREFIAYISFANEEGRDFIYKEMDYDWSNLSVKIDGRSPEFQEMKFLRYDEEKEKAFYVYTARRHTAKVPKGENVSIQLKGLFESNEWKEDIELTNVAREADTRGVKIHNSNVNENFVKLENEDFPYMASVLDMTPLAEINTEEVSVTGIAYIDGVLCVQVCQPDYVQSNTDFRIAYINSNEQENEQIYWYEKINGQMMLFQERYYEVSEDILNEFQMQVLCLEKSGLLNTIWEVEFEVKK